MFISILKKLAFSLFAVIFLFFGVGGPTSVLNDLFGSIGGTIGFIVGGAFTILILRNIAYRIWVSDKEAGPYLPIAVTEIDMDKCDPELWAMARMKSKGDKGKQESIYIKQRAEMLARENRA